MELKAKLSKPITEKERFNFIIEYNHKLGYIIKEDENEIKALWYTKEEELEENKKVNKIKKDIEFKEKKEIILKNFLDALIHEDNIKIKKLKNDMKELDSWYAREINYDS